ncbi:hypothetical protein Srufu_024090 [Streptomyces libani subsp. rufus]|nr:hypothetical protein Srufu_024090 [Streptomyces libani subsp. rufus]
MPERLIDRLAAVGGLRDDLDIRRRAEDRAHTGPHQGLVVGEEDPGTADGRAAAGLSHTVRLSGGNGPPACPGRAAAGCVLPQPGGVPGPSGTVPGPTPGGAGC